MPLECISAICCCRQCTALHGKVSFLSLETLYSGKFPPKSRPSPFKEVDVNLSDANVKIWTSA